MKLTEIMKIIKLESLQVVGYCYKVAILNYYHKKEKCCSHEGEDKLGSRGATVAP